jgi:hypothetical protein
MEILQFEVDNDGLRYYISCGFNLRIQFGALYGRALLAGGW